MQQLLVKLMQRSYVVIWQAKYPKQQCPPACGKVSAAGSKFKSSPLLAISMQMCFPALHCACSPCAHDFVQLVFKGMSSVGCNPTALDDSAAATIELWLVKKFVSRHGSAIVLCPYSPFPAPPPPSPLVLLVFQGLLCTHLL